MTLVRKREYLVLLAGDVAVSVFSLWLALTLRYAEFPTWDFYLKHLLPFLFIFAAGVGVFFLAGLYGKYTRLFRSRLPSTILYTQLLNVALAALFFFLIPAFGLAPKTILVIYLIVSSLLIYLWRVFAFPRLPRLLRGKKPRGILIASGADAHALAEEVASDSRYPFKFETVIDTDRVPVSGVIQQVCRLAEESETTFLVVDFSDKAFEAVRPIVYDAAFQKRGFAILDIIDVYQEVFDRMPLSLIRYEWILSSVAASRAYDIIKRATDILGALMIGIVSLLVYPFAVIAIKLDDGGPIFIAQERVGRFEQPIRILKFRSMSGNDQGKYDESGKSKLKVTRAGKWLRLLRVDEFPQLLSVLRGDLSLVGPRPELPALARQYSAKIPYYNARYLVTPGLTGWAQIKHDRHPHHGTDIAETKEKLTYDLYYLKRRSLLLDIFIILQTIRIVLTARGS